MTGIFEVHDMQALKDVYHLNAYQYGEAPKSYWASTANLQVFDTLTETVEAEVAIIGGGITGLVAALRLAKDFGKNVVLLEAGQIGWGASGRAGGFNSGMATKLSLSGLKEKFGLAATREFAEQQDRATDLVYEIAGDEKFDIEAAGSGVFVAAMSSRAAHGLEKQVKTYQATIGKTAEFLNKTEFQDRVHAGAFVWGGLHIPGGTGLHPLKYTAGLARAAARHGARIFANSQVLSWRKDGARHSISTERGTVTAARVIVATNAYTSDGLNNQLDRRILPLISNILVTRQLTDTELKRAGYSSYTPVYTSKNKLFYYRLLPDNRFLIGGRGDTVGSEKASSRQNLWLVDQFRKMFPAWNDVDISYNWSGLVCVTRRGVPALGVTPDDQTIGYAFGCHGSGINNATWMGYEQARLMASDNPARAAETLPSIVRALPARIFGPRRSIINMAYLAYSVVDAWENRPTSRDTSRPG